VQQTFDSTQQPLAVVRDNYHRIFIVRIPSAARFCEALILLLCQDYDTRYETYWMALMTYVLEYMDETDIFDEKDLRDEYRPFYCALKKGEPTVFELLDELRNNLSSSGHLPQEHT
jgi:hypothetical protein